MEKRNNTFLLILFISFFLSSYLILHAQNYISRYPERTKYAYEHDWRKDSEENLIALDLFIDVEKSCLNSDYTSAILLINKILAEYPHGRLGKPRITKSISTGVSRDYCYCYRNKIYDFALTYKAILLCKINKFIEAQNLLETYLANLKSLNNYTEDYKIDFLNDAKFIEKFSSKWTADINLLKKLYATLKNDISNQDFVAKTWLNIHKAKEIKNYNARALVKNNQNCSYYLIKYLPKTPDFNTPKIEIINY